MISSWRVFFFLSFLSVSTESPNINRLRLSTKIKKEDLVFLVLPRIKKLLMRICSSKKNRELTNTKS